MVTNSQSMQLTADAYNRISVSTSFQFRGFMLESVKLDARRRHETSVRAAFLVMLIIMQRR